MAPTSLVLTVRDVAGALHISRSTAYRLINEGTIESIQVRGMIRVRPSALERYLDAGCLSDEEKMAMRIAVFRGLMEIHDTDAERDARQKIIDVASANLDEGLEAMEAVVECWKAERAARRRPRSSWPVPPGPFDFPWRAAPRPKPGTSRGAGPGTLLIGQPGLES